MRLIWSALGDPVSQRSNLGGCQRFSGFFRRHAIIKVGGLEIDLLNRRVRSGTSVLHLTAMEQALLYLLASNPGRTVDRESILDALWGTDYVAESNLVDRHVRNLRVKLKNSWRRPRFIATVPGKGYRFLPLPDA